MGSSLAIRCEHRDRGLWISLDRPSRRNALSIDMFAGLAAAFDEAGDAIYIVLTGAGADFSAGGDLSALEALSADPKERESLIASLYDESTRPLLAALARRRQPILLAARGHCIGAGALLLLAADLVIGSKTLKLSIPQVRLGHCADHGESWFLPRKVGAGRAAELLLLGRPIDGAQAERIGLVNWLVADTQLEAMTAEIAGELARMSETALFETKALLRSSLASNLEAQAEAERSAVLRCAQSNDFIEALSAFRERRTPQFKTI